MFTDAMTPNCTIAPAEPINGISAALLEAFGVRFHLWLYEAGAWVLANADELDAVSVPPPAPADSLPRFGDFAQFGEPQIITNPNTKGEYWLQIPFRSSAGQEVLATALLVTADSNLLFRLASAFVKQWNFEQQVLAHREEVDAYAGQISEDFEELTFLRNLANHLSLTEVSQDVWQASQVIVPLLGNLVKAESLLLIAADPVNGLPAPVDVGAVIVRSGASNVSDDTCRELVTIFREAALRRPIVRSRLDAKLRTASLASVHNFVLVPVSQREATLGWLLAINRRSPRPAGDHEVVAGQDDFGSVEASLLSSTATVVATHAHNVQLFREKEALLVAIVRSMVAAIDALDPYTSGHSERVALVARRLGEEMGLDGIDAERLYFTGLLHDVGKIGVSSNVLNKPARLSDDEFDAIKRHPDDGWAILHDLDQLRYVLPGVLHHHERYDGQGYPDGLRGEAIPRDARILAVADSFDAMTSNRPYRKGMPDEKVDTILRTGAGTQWDPDVVDAYFRARDDIRDICRNHEAYVRPVRTRPAGV